MSSHQKLSLLPFPHVSPHPSFDHRPHIRRKSLIAFGQTMQKSLPAVHIFNFNSYNLISVSPSLQKCSPSFNLACCPHQVWTPLPLSENFVRNPADTGESRPSAKYCSFPNQKNLLHQIATFTFTKLPSFIYSRSHCCCIIFFNFRLYVHTYHDNFD